MHIRLDTPQKERQFALRFYTKIQTVYVTQFFMIFKIFIYIQKPWQFTLRAVLTYKNLDTSQTSRHFLLRLYIYKNPDTLRYTIFHGIFDIGRGGGGIFIF